MSRNGKDRIAKFGSTKEFFEYDHLGNTRVAFSNSYNCISHASTFTVKNAVNYYPYGKVLRSFAGSSLERYGYQSSEREPELGDNDYYTLFRGLDGDIARWKQFDPKPSFNISPYASMGCNPILNNDPNGDTDTHYYTEGGEELANTADGNNTGVVVSKRDENMFRTTVQNAPAANLNDKVFNTNWTSYLSGNGGTTLSEHQVYMLQGLDTDWSRGLAINYWKDPSISNGAKFSFAASVSQWTDPQKVVGGLSVGIGGLESMPKALSSREVRSIASNEKQILIHQEKLANYIADPMKSDNKGFLKNAPNEAIKQQIMKTRVDHLNHEIKTFKKNIKDIKKR